MVNCFKTTPFLSRYKKNYRDQRHDSKTLYNLSKIGGCYQIEPEPGIEPRGQVTNLHLDSGTTSAFSVPTITEIIQSDPKISEVTKINKHRYPK